jgi:hypothetical protein
MAPGWRRRQIRPEPRARHERDPPDICLFYGNPAQMILFINGLQWRSYQRYDLSIIGESASADSWAMR